MSRRSSTSFASTATSTASSPKRNSSPRTHFATAYRQNLEDAADRNEIRNGDCEVWSWALIGMTVFLGMRFALWDEDRTPSATADAAFDLVSAGLARKQ